MKRVLCFSCLDLAAMWLECQALSALLRVESKGWDPADVEVQP